MLLLQCCNGKTQHMQPIRTSQHALQQVQKAFWGILAPDLHATSSLKVSTKAQLLIATSFQRETLIIHKPTHPALLTTLSSNPQSD